MCLGVREAQAMGFDFAVRSSRRKHKQFGLRTRDARVVPTFYLCTWKNAAAGLQADVLDDT